MKDVERWKTPLLCKNEQSLAHMHSAIQVCGVREVRKDHFRRDSHPIVHFPTDYITSLIVKVSILQTFTYE